MHPTSRTFGDYLLPILATLVCVPMIIVLIVLSARYEYIGYGLNPVLAVPVATCFMLCLMYLWYCVGEADATHSASADPVDGACRN